MNKCGVLNYNYLFDKLKKENKKTLFTLLFFSDIIVTNKSVISNIKKTSKKGIK
jgi:hypothetical protein